MKNKKGSKLISLITGLVLVLALVQLVIAHQLATVGDKVRRLEKETNQIETESWQLSEEISKVGALSRISSQAAELGLVRTTRVVHLAPEVPFALK